MKTRPLGRTGLHVSEIGFGTWGLGGNVGGAIAYGPADDRESLRALHAALDCGINFYDTADFYGFGHSERLLGEAFAGRRDRIIISTKAGFLDKTGAQDFSETHLRAALDGSLRRLQTDYVDVLMLHNPPAQLLAAEPRILATLESLRREGKARAWGISVRSPEEGLLVVERHDCPVIEVNFNLADQRARQIGLLDLCARRGAGCVIRTPLCFGFLTGQYDADAEFDASDHRRRWPVEQRRRWIEAVRLFSEALVRKQPQTQAQLALRFCLSYPAVATAIPGMLTTAHVEENAAAAALGPLGAAELRDIEAIYEGREFFLPGRRPDQQSIR